MSEKQVKSGPRGWAVGVAALCVAASCAWGEGAQGIAHPLYAGNVVPLQDEFGRPMRGSPRPSAAAARPRVEVRVAYTNRIAGGEIFAPGTNGAASEVYNPLVSPDAVGGIGQNSATTNSGLFCMVFPQRPARGVRIFARAYDAPTAADALFYADSDIVAVATNDTAVTFTFGPMKALRTGDADGDGLNDSWEALLGIDDRATGDYDGDGMGDLQEMLAGTAPDDATSKLTFRLVQRAAEPRVLAEGAEPTRPVRVKWQSVPGKKYQLEHVVQLVPDPASGQTNLFYPVGDPIVAGAGEFEIDVMVDVEEGLTGAFRVKLVQE